MTQTVRKITKSQDGDRVVSIYADYGQGRTHLAYDVEVTKIPATKAAEWAIEELHAADWDEGADYLKDVIRHIMSVARNGYVWRVTASGSHDLDLDIEQEYHSSREKAMDVATSQFC